MRRLITALLLTIGTGVVSSGLISFIQWRGRQALMGDARAEVERVGDLWLRALHSRRGTLTFLRETLERQRQVNPAQAAALGVSAVHHTRHLGGAGLLTASSPPAWWAHAEGFPSADVPAINQAILTRARLPGIWRVPSTFTVESSTQRIWLVMMEPLRHGGGVEGLRTRPSAVLGFFDVTALAEDFLSANVSSRFPTQVLAGDTLLHRSRDWKPDAPMSEHPITLDATRFIVQMQPGRTRVSQTLSWVTAFLIALSVMSALGVIVVIWLLAIRARLLQRVVMKRTAALRRTSSRLRQLATTDELTGLYNRRFFLNRWDWECARAKRYHRPLGCLMVDVDHFKRVNDRLGHRVGDLVLKQVAQELRTMLRESDILARFGGDEFIVALPETNPDQAEAVAEKLRRMTVRVPEGDKHGVPTVRLSVGMSRVEREDDAPEQILEAADHALYEWKRRRHPALRQHG
jgi:diguanylate cyclase (GGDEF)-like protein